MKANFYTIILILTLTFLNPETAKAQLTLNCESGNRAIEQGNCWGFGSVSYTNTSNLIIAGSWSTRSNSMSNPALNSSWIKTPWMKAGSGNITFQTRLENSTGTTKQIVLSYIPYDVNAGVNKEGTLTTFSTFDFPKNGTVFSTGIQTISVPVPSAIENSSDAYKIFISFVGTGGNNRAICDNFVIPGTYWSDPLNNCLPLSLIADADGDGVQDSDDHYPNDATRAYNNYFPSSEKFGTLAFEDTWPSKGDFDMNDLVVNYQINRVTNADNQLVEIKGTFVSRASGAGFHNAFGFQLNNIKPDAVRSVTGNKTGNNDVFKFDANGLESNQEFANCIVFDDIYRVLKYPGKGVFINVSKDAPFVPYDTTKITLTLNPGIALSALNMNDINFYIVADVLKSGRGREIHLIDGVPTSLVDNTYFGKHDDISSGSRYYRTANNLPWGINISEGFDYMTEKISIDKGYNNFIKWAESGGVEFIDWYSAKEGNRNPALIY